ncbi:hypothetical protein GE061_018705 [Apolygus lucorum]|uniref:Uncharacterized protein n=1 Tax=Apolygus lucorum TaxID=248454 RepID=A0A6A4IZN5_APOLU|nr:hypothetical protein GE061_018705 [Apolygus lucorum]
MSRLSSEKPLMSLIKRWIRHSVLHSSGKKREHHSRRGVTNLPPRLTTYQDAVAALFGASLNRGFSGADADVGDQKTLRDEAAAGDADAAPRRPESRPRRHRNDDRAGEKRRSGDAHRAETRRSESRGHRAAGPPGQLRQAELDGAARRQECRRPAARRHQVGHDIHEGGRRQQTRSEIGNRQRRRPRHHWSSRSGRP